MHPRTSTTDLALDDEAPSIARRVSGLVLRQWGVRDEDSLDAVSLVVSELVTNVLVHCEAVDVVTLRLVLREDTVEVSVADPHPLVPRQRTADEEEEGGRGLSIVSVLASRWGVEAADGGKRVFAELPVVSARCA